MFVYVKLFNNDLAMETLVQKRVPSDLCQCRCDVQFFIACVGPFLSGHRQVLFVSKADKATFLN